MADLGFFQLLPIQIEMDGAAQGFELIQLFPPDQFRRSLMNRFGFRFGGGHVHEFPDEFLVQIQGCTHRQILFGMPVSYA